ncbi:MAG TPA: hypothetical protein ENI75_03010 [Mizugakiibacter sp.]|nr:hypothetical protein [Mizugakiibacter sp.]
MRLAFPQTSRADFLTDRGSVSLGTSPYGDVPLDGRGIAPCHIQLVANKHGVSLTVQADAATVYVNARPVHERALLRCGDRLSIGSAQVLLLSDQPPAPAPDVHSMDTVPSIAHLRAVAGPWSGRSFRVLPHLYLPLGSQLPGPQSSSGSIRLVWRAGYPCLLGGQDPSSMQCCRVNGYPIKSARLDDGDQIMYGMHRFIVDAPVLAARYDSAHAFLPEEAAVPEDTAGSRREVWWLLFAAALVSFILALILAG